MLDSLLTMAIQASRRAGVSILNVLEQENIFEYKSDGTPLTLADKESHNHIFEQLSLSEIPCISEEGETMSLSAGRYWLIDPLDGTKDFLAKSKEFTVNIALIENGFPVLGVVYAPALNELYAGSVITRAFCSISKNRVESQVLKKSSNLRMVTSRFHDDPDLKLFTSENQVTNVVYMGSALKFCRLAFGDADVYPRIVGSSEWDSAAGQAVLESAGGSVLNWNTGRRLRYGKKNRRNPRILSFRKPYSFHDFRLKKYEEDLK